MLVVGHHRLEGKAVPLKKPFAVVVREDPASMSSSSSTEEAAAVGARPSYAVVAVLAEKYVFKNRPQPIVTDDTRAPAAPARTFLRARADMALHGTARTPHAGSAYTRPADRPTSSVP